MSLHFITFTLQYTEENVVEDGCFLLVTFPYTNVTHTLENIRVHLKYLMQFATLCTLLFSLKYHKFNMLKQAQGAKHLALLV